MKGRPDVLLGFQKVENAVYGRYPLAIQSKYTEDKVEGTVYEVSGSDMEKADLYETSAYKREKFLLQSGQKAWVYIENSQ